MWNDYLLISKYDFIYGEMKLTPDEMVITKDLENNYNVYQVVNSILEYVGNAVFAEPVNRLEKNNALEPLDCLLVLVIDRDRLIQRVYRLKLKNRIVIGVTELKPVRRG
jgi:hypothetical protein